MSPAKTFLYRYRILTQNLFSAAGKFKLPWLLAGVALLGLGGFAAMSAMPAETPQHIHFETITEDVLLPMHKDALNDDTFWQIEQTRRDDTLATLFKRMSIRDEDALKFLQLNPKARAISAQLVPGRTIEIKSNREGKMLYLEYELDTENMLMVGLTGEGYQIAEQKLILDNRRMLRSATIVDTLFNATDDADIPDAITLQIADIFSGEIDFNQDLNRGDKINVIYEAFYNAGELMKTGNILAVQVITGKKSHFAIRFGEGEGKYAYYTPDGKSLHASFLRSPVEFSRVSSTFTAARFHPILHHIRAHQGVDFAAPMGTRVKAASDGEVTFVGKGGGYGNVVILKHANGISTKYGHLSAFAAGLHVGNKVTQGDIIGFVGMTGLATGPHLHYEFLIDGVHRDPLTVALPTSIPLDKQYRSQFDTLSLDYVAQVAMLDRNKVVLGE